MAKLKPEPKPTRARSTRIKDLDTKKKREDATKGKSDAGVKKKTTTAAAKKKSTATAKKVKDAVAKKAPAVKKTAAAAKPAAKKTAAAAKPKAKSAAKEVKKAATTKKAAPKKPAAKTTKKTIAKKPAPKKATTTKPAAKETMRRDPRRYMYGARIVRGGGGRRRVTAPQTADDDFAAKEAAVRAAYIPSPVKPTVGRGKKPAAAPPSDDSSDGSNGSDSSSSDISIPLADIFRRAYIAGGVPLVRQTHENQNAGLAKIFDYEKALLKAGKKGTNLKQEPDHVDGEHRHAWYLGGPGLVALLDSNPKKARADMKAIGKIVPRLRSRETGLHRLAEELGGSRLHFLLSYTPAEALRHIEEDLAERDAGKKTKKASPSKSRTALHRRAFALGGATLERLLDNADAREGVIEYIEFLEGHPEEQVRVHAANKEEEDRQERGDLERRARALGIGNDLRDLIYEDIDEARRRVEGMEAKAQGKGKGKTPSPAKSTRRSASPVKSTRRSASPVKSTTAKKGKTPSPTKSGVQKRGKTPSPAKRSPGPKNQRRPTAPSTTTLPTDLYRRAHYLGGPALQTLFVQNPAAAVPQIQKLTKNHNRNPKPSAFPPPTTTQRSPLEQGAFYVGGENFVRFMYDDPYAAMRRLREIVEGRGVPETHRVRTHANSLRNRMEQEAAEAGLEVDEYMWGGPR